MNEHVSEITGFLCRWALLAVATVVAGAGVYASMTATAEVVRGPTMDMAFSDGISAESGPRGFVITSGEIPREPRHFVVGPPGGDKRLTTHNMIADLSGSGLSPGVNEIDVWGIPYDCLAFRKYRAACLGDLAGQRVFLVDMRTAHAFAADDATMLTACLDEMARRGSVVMFYTGSLEQFAEMRTNLRKIDVPAAALFWRSSRPSPAKIAWRIARQLRRDSGAASVCLTTDDPNLAHLFASRAVETYLVAPKGAAPASQANLWVFPTPEDLQRRLTRLQR